MFNYNLAETVLIIYLQSGWSHLHSVAEFNLNADVKGERLGLKVIAGFVYSFLRYFLVSTLAY